MELRVYADHESGVILMSGQNNGPELTWRFRNRDKTMARY